MANTMLDTMNHPVKNELQERWARMRTHPRVVSPVKFKVEWEEESSIQRANGITVDISKSGCLAVVGAGLPLRRRVRLINSRNGRVTEARVVWRDHEAWNVGLELVKPDAAFWGLTKKSADTLR